MRISGNEPFGEENLHGFGEEAGAGEVVDEMRPLLCAVAGFFGQFAFCAIDRLFACVELSGWQLPEELSGSIAELTLDDDPGIFFASW